ncbi:hypothetical protein LBC_02640 [Campylobacter sp. 19-13652]|nr:hypothetical protein LBC_02640 [Campylobacter sp. 19-13652]
MNYEVALFALTLIASIAVAICLLTRLWHASQAVGLHLPTPLTTLEVSLSFKIVWQQI